MAVELPANATAIFNPLGGMSHTEAWRQGFIAMDWDDKCWWLHSKILVGVNGNYFEIDIAIVTLVLSYSSLPTIQDLHWHANCKPIQVQGSTLWHYHTKFEKGTSRWIMFGSTCWRTTRQLSRLDVVGNPLNEVGWVLVLHVQHLFIYLAIFHMSSAWQC